MAVVDLGMPTGKYTYYRHLRCHCRDLSPLAPSWGCKLHEAPRSDMNCQALGIHAQGNQIHGLTSRSAGRLHGTGNAATAEGIGDPLQAPPPPLATWAQPGRVVRHQVREIDDVDHMPLATREGDQGPPVPLNSPEVRDDVSAVNPMRQ